MAKSLLAVIIGLVFAGIVGLVELYLLERFEAKYTSRQAALFYASLAVATISAYAIVSNILGA